jgi:hypothetical protein
MRDILYLFVDTAIGAGQGCSFFTKSYSRYPLDTSANALVIVRRASQFVVPHSATLRHSVLGERWFSGLV